MKAMQWLQKKRSKNQKPRWPSLLMDHHQSKTQTCLRNYDDLLNQQAFSTTALKIHENCMKMCQNDNFQKNCKQYDFWMKWNLSLKGQIPPPTTNSTFLSLTLTPKSIGLLLVSKATHASSVIIVCQKVIVIVRKIWKVQSPYLTLTFDQMTRKSKEVLLGSWWTYVWSIIIVCKKVMGLLCRNSTKFQVWIRPWPLTYWHKNQ